MAQALQFEKDNVGQQWIPSVNEIPDQQPGFESIPTQGQVQDVEKDSKEIATKYSIQTPALLEELKRLLKGKVYRNIEEAVATAQNTLDPSTPIGKALDIALRQQFEDVLMTKRIIGAGQDQPVRSNPNHTTFEQTPTSPIKPGIDPSIIKGAKGASKS